MRAPFNRTMNVWNGPAFGGLMRFAGVPYRKVLRDESDGIPSSPTFGFWITSPIAQVLRGSQTDGLSRFDLTRGDRLYDTVTLNLIGVVLWSETWLPGTPNNYQRCYVASGSALDPCIAGVAFGLACAEPPPPLPATALALAFGLGCTEPPPPPEAPLMALAFALYDQPGSVPTPITTIALAINLTGLVPEAPDPQAWLALAFDLTGLVPGPPDPQAWLALAFALDGFTPGPPDPQALAAFAFNIAAS